MKQDTSRRQRGQSLVEIALFLPVALIIIAGLVELSLYLVTQNKVDTAAREAARFGANGGEDVGMVTVVFNTVTQTLELDIDRWDLWTVRGQVRATCSGSNTIFDFGLNDQNFTVTHTYGISQTVAYTDTQTHLYSDEFRNEVLQELVGPVGNTGTCNANNPAPDANGLQFVGMYAAHDMDSILGLDVFLENVFTVRALHVFRITSLVSTDQTEGCDAFPIALDERNRSVNQTDYTTYVMGTNANQRYPDPPPTYNSFRQDGHLPEHSLVNQAREGDVFLFRGEGLENDFNNYAWLQWNTDNSCPGGCGNGHDRLRDSMIWPGNSLDLIRGFHEVGDFNDTELTIGDRVAYSEANGAAVSNNVETLMREYIDRGRTIRIILWNEYGTLDGSPPQNYITVSQFANVRLLGYHFTGGPTERWFMFQFVSYDNSCGQASPLP